jgi:hypothetical protein
MDRYSQSLETFGRECDLVTSKSDSSAEQSEIARLRRQLDVAQRPFHIPGGSGSIPCRLTPSPELNLKIAAEVLRRLLRSW